MLAERGGVGLGGHINNGVVELQAVLRIPSHHVSRCERNRAVQRVATAPVQLCTTVATG